MWYILTLIDYFVNIHIEYKNSVMLPTKKEYCPIFCDSFFPSQKPNKVKKALIKQKDINAINKLSYIYLIPKPTDKLSKLTEKANNNIPMMFNALNLGFSSKKCINISIESRRKTKNITNFGLIMVYSNKETPIALPISGIKKWNKPTKC